MPPATPPPDPEALILAMLRDVLARQAAAMGLSAEAPAPAAPASVPTVPPPVPSPASVPAPMPTPLSGPAPTPVSAIPTPPPVAAAPPRVRHTRAEPPAHPLDDDEPLSPREAEALAEMEALAAAPAPVSGLPAAMRWLAAALAVALLIVNLPVINGVAPIRALADQASVVVRDGMLLRGSDEAVYVVEGGVRRLISSEVAFLHYGYRWGAVTVVDDDLLREIPRGEPRHVLVQCEGSSDVYVLEGFEKRWVSDVAALEPAGYSLERDVARLPCGRLRSITDGRSFP